MQSLLVTRTACMETFQHPLEAFFASALQADADQTHADGPRFSARFRPRRDAIAT